MYMKHPIYLQIIVSALGLSLVGYVGILSWNAYASHRLIGQPENVRDTITLGGEGKVTSKPDVANVSIGVFTTGAEVSTTQEQNTQQMNRIIAAMKALGVKDEDIQTSNYNVYPEYDYNEGQRVLRDYRVSQDVAIKVRDLGKIGDVLAKAGELGSNQIYGVSFDVDDKTDLEKQARDEAIADAKTKAEALAKQLGVHIGKVVSFSENGGAYPVPMMDYAYAEKASAGVGGAQSPDIQSGSFDVTKNVSITFEIR